MSEYWKSQPKKFCDFCKCWITDNRASVDFHERGKNHLENVKIRIDEVKKKGTARREQQDQLNDDLAAIEAAAMKAYRKDLGYCDVPKPKPPKIDSKHEIKPTENAAASVSTIIDDIWSAHQTPESYWYYYNNKTGETTWDPPHGSQAYDQSNISKAEQTEDEKEIITQPPLTEDDISTKEKTSTPFGAWETVAIYDSSTTKEEEEEDKKVKSDEVPAMKFKEKQLPTTTSKATDLSDDVAFKKRKSNQGKKRSIRQRTDDDS